MATLGAVFGVIRASRPTLRTAIERVAFAVHAAFLAAGYSVVAVGAAANNAPANDDESEEPEVGFEGWDSLEGAYAFRYVGATGQIDLCKSVTLKIVVMVDSLMVDVAQFGSENLHHLEIRASDFAKDGDGGGNYAHHFINLDGLIKQVNERLLSKLSPPRTPTLVTSASTSLAQQNDMRRASAPPLLYDTRRSIGNPGFVFPPIFIGGNSDLYPRPGGGIFAPRRDFGSDGMLIGPHDVRWRHPIGGLQPHTLNFEDLMVPQNARYDPIGPLDIPGMDTIDYDRSTNRPPERNPDLEHF